MLGFTITAAVFVLLYGLAAFLLGAHVYYKGTLRMNPVPPVRNLLGKIEASGGDETEETLPRTRV